MKRPLRLSLLCALLVLVFGGDVASAQNVEGVSDRLLKEVMPQADRFTAAEGDPPVKRGFRGEELVGYVFMTSDVPPEQRGYSGPVVALAGVTPDGTLTGVRVIDYHESYMRQKGDFLRNEPGFQEQYAGKYIGDAFRVYEDIDGIARVSITVRALSRGVRDAARRVAAAYAELPEPPRTPVEDITTLSWFDMRQRGVVSRMEISEGDDFTGISFIYVASDTVAKYLVGDGFYDRGLRAVERRGGAEHLMLYGIDGSSSRFSQDGWSLVQHGDTAALTYNEVIMLSSPWEGLMSGEVSQAGMMILDGAVDPTEPFELVFRPRSGGVYSVAYPVPGATTPLLAEAEPAPGPSSATADAATSAVAERSFDFPDDSQLDFADEGEETALQRLFASASWARVGWIGLVLSLATLAFFTKVRLLRWISLATTFVVLGYVDGGFLSISHLTSVIWVGPSVLLQDLPLLLMVVFTVVTVIFWGRVFCGFLCPFGALQDFIDGIVPARFKRQLPRGVHRVALKAKYGVLALIVIPALAGSETSLYQYFEPFGTVFFLGTNVVLWGIAGSILLAAVFVPRFYCRYACPLGAALAIGSFISIRRIRRVEQCGFCKVCQQKCPTGAIDGPAIDFGECVRCNVCETLLAERAGVCRHDMDVIRPRLVQLKVGSAVGMSDRVLPSASARS